MLRLVLLAGLAVSAFSQSSQCTTALGQVAADSNAATCLNIPALVKVLNTPADSSIVSPVNEWLVGLCGQQACNDATLTSIANTVSTGCPAELKALGFASGGEFKAAYPVFRKIVCLKHGSTLCATEFHTAVEKVTGTLTLSKVAQLSTNPPTLSKEITCTNCAKASFNILAQALAQADPTKANTLKTSFQQLCGAAFVDGQNPSDVTQSAV